MGSEEKDMEGKGKWTDPLVLLEPYVLTKNTK